MTTKAAPKPVSAAEAFQRKQASANLVPLGVLLVLLLVYLFLLLPSPLPFTDYPWRQKVLVPQVTRVLLAPFPTPKPDAAPPIPPQPLIQWLIWGVCAFEGYLAFRFFQHIRHLSMQQAKPLAHPRTYLRLRVPVSAALDPKCGEALLRSLHGLLPPMPRKPDGSGVPIVLRWSGLPDQPIRQGVSVFLPAEKRISVEKTLEGLTDSTMVDEQPDPLISAAQPGRVLAWTDLVLATADAYPLAMTEGRSKPLLEALLPTLAAPAGVAVTDVQIMLRPVIQADWRLRVQARADRLKLDTTAPERKAMDRKAAGPGYDVTIRVAVIADDANVAKGYLGAIVGNFAATAQTIGTAQQRLRPTGIQSRTIPKGVLFPPQPEKKAKPAKGKPEKKAKPAKGKPDEPIPMPEKSAPPPKRFPKSIRGVLLSVSSSRNPKIIPLFGSWFGHHPKVLSVAELATLWHPPTTSLMQRVESILARWLTVPQNAFVDASDPRNLVMGTGRKADSSWAPIGFDYADLRYVMWITAPMGRGKSVWLQHLFGNLMRADAGCMLVDCKGTDLVNDSLPLVPLEREKDVTIVSFGGTNITGEDLRVSMNLLSPGYGRSLGLDASKQAATVLGLFPAIDPRFDDAVGIKQFANMGLLALAAGEPRATMAHLIRFFGDECYRAQVVERIPGEMAQVKDFWQRRFEEMPDGQKSSLASFERRLDQLLTFPELAAMLIAPGCSIDMRRMMDHKGILMAGVKATEGPIAAIGGTLLLLQMLTAALSRDNVSQKQRPDWPLIIDEAHIILSDNAGLAKVMFSQLRSFRIGQVIVHQGINQFPPPVLIPLRDNAQYRVILGSESGDAATYASQHGATGVTAQDFTQMERFEHQYLKFLGTQLFSSRMLPMPQPLQEEPLPPVERDWRDIQASVQKPHDQTLDQMYRKVRHLVQSDQVRQAVDELAALCRHRPDQYDAYCARTQAHRLAQRQFILENPGSIPAKETRIRVLSALRSGVPRVETAALQWALLQDTVAAGEAAAMAAEGRKGKGKGKKPTSAAIPGMAPGEDAVVVAPLIAQGKSAEDLARERALRGAGVAEGEWE